MQQKSCNKRWLNHVLTKWNGKQRCVWYVLTMAPRRLCVASITGTTNLCLVQFHYTKVKWHFGDDRIELGTWIPVRTRVHKTVSNALFPFSSFGKKVINRCINGFSIEHLKRTIETKHYFQRAHMWFSSQRANGIKLNSIHVDYLKIFGDINKLHAI